MPVVSQAQYRFFQAIRHNKQFARKVNVPKKVADKFIRESDGINYKELPKRKKNQKVKGYRRSYRLVRRYRRARPSR